jgi:hypothetical protein
MESRPEAASVIEVKSTASVKAQHLPDVAVQAHVLGHSGVEASRLEIMHLNRTCAYPDLSNLFTRAGVTAQAQDALEAMPGVIQDQLAMLAGPLPDVAIGEHCRIPYECPFMGRCWPAPLAHHVSTLHSAGRRALVLEERGPETFPLSPYLSATACYEKSKSMLDAIRRGGWSARTRRSTLNPV